MKKIRRIILMVASVTLMMAFSVEIIAADQGGNIQPQDNGYYTWEITDYELVGTTTLGADYEYYSTSEPAEAGERRIMTVAYSEKATANAELELTVRDAVLSIGLTYETSYSISDSVLSRALSDGERVSSFTVTRYTIYRVKQEYGYKLHNDFYSNGTVKYALVYVPQQTPGIHLCYHYGTMPNCTHTPE